MSDPGDETMIGRHRRLVEDTTAERRAQTAREIVQEEQRRTCGNLLIAMANALELALNFAYQQTGHSLDYGPIRRELRDAKILFASTLDRS